MVSDTRVSTPSKFESFITCSFESSPLLLFLLSVPSDKGPNREEGEERDAKKGWEDETLLLVSVHLSHTVLPGTLLKMEPAGFPVCSPLLRAQLGPEGQCEWGDLPSRGYLQPESHALPGACTPDSFLTFLHLMFRFSKSPQRCQDSCGPGPLHCQLSASSPLPTPLHAPAPHSQVPVWKL